MVHVRVVDFRRAVIDRLAYLRCADCSYPVQAGHGKACNMCMHPCVAQAITCDIEYNIMVTDVQAPHSARSVLVLVLVGLVRVVRVVAIRVVACAPPHDSIPASGSRIAGRVRACQHSERTCTRKSGATAVHGVRGAVQGKGPGQAPFFSLQTDFGKNA